MSTPTVNHNTRMHHQQQQQQPLQLQQTIEHMHSNLDSTTQATTLTRSDSTSTVILEEEVTPSRRRNGPSIHRPALWPSLSIRLRSLLKTSGLFNKDGESTDKLSELFASGDKFTLQKLLSEFNPNEVNFDMNELMKLDSTKFADARTLSEFLRSESFDQLIASAANNTDFTSTSLANPCSSLSFSELRPVSPELATTNMFPTQSNDLRLYNPMDSFDPSTATSTEQFNPNQNALNAIDHDHAFLSKRTDPSSDLPSTSICDSRRVSSRLQSRAVDSTSTASTSKKRKRTQNASRAKDIKTADDLNYYLERRRKNNEASKMSRAARKQKFGTMDQQCDEYERVNTALRTKISTLESVTSSLKNGLVNNFQRKNSA